MDILALSVWIRYLELCDHEIVFPANAYQGEYVKDIAGRLRQMKGDACKCGHRGRFSCDLPEDVEQSIDRLIASVASRFWGQQTTKRCLILPVMRWWKIFIRDLEEFGVVFQEWFSERSLLDRGDISQAIATLEKNGHIFEKEGALWFRATDFGDEKDSCRSQGQRRSYLFCF